MKRYEMLLAQAAEEASEVAQAAIKCPRFGPDEVYPKIGIPNIERFLLEFADLMTIVDLLRKEGVFQGAPIRLAQMAAKKVKVEKMLLYSKELGRLD